ncbi:MAG TPA: FG-GAP-like repeat-containing protein [Candidatus Acidoferrum sp.]|nr:FG-GAP-like repeat-containing protein [Candidatus Acidoferrum sp.]
MGILKAAAVVLTFAMLAFSPMAFATNNPLPAIATPLVPTTVAPGGPAFTLAIKGTGFVSGSTVQWNGSGRPTTFVNGSQLNAQIAASDVANAGTFSITVSNPAPGGGTSSPVYFTVGLPTTTVTFGSSKIPTNFPQFVFPVRVVIGDFNGDGKPDVATFNIDCSVSVLLSNGDGTFQLPVTNTSIPTDRLPDGIVAGDFNGDGKLDLAVKDHRLIGALFEVTVLPGNGDGTFGTPTPAINLNPKTTVGTTFVAADFNGDGKLDLVTDCQQGGPMVCVLNGNGDGTFTAGATVQVPAFSGQVATAVSDLNGDGKLDLVFGFSNPLGNPSNRAILAVSFGNGDGTFGTIRAVDIIAPPPQQGLVGLDVAVADFDGNGIPDIAFAYESCSNTSPCPVNLQVYPGNGDGTFQPALPPQSVPAIAANKLVVGDLNNDGVLDLAFGTSLFIGRGDGTFTESANPLPQIGAFLADLNGDGFLDFVGLSTTSALYSELRTPPDFSGFASPKSQTVVAGLHTSYSIEVDPLLGWFTDVNLTISGLPAGVTATFAPAKVPFGSGTSLLSLTTSPLTTPGTYTLTVSGTAGTLTHTTTITLVVNPATADFGGDITPASQLIAGGQQANYAIQVLPYNGFTGDVSLSVSGTPPGSIVNFNPPIVPGGSGSSVLTVIVPPSVRSGAYTLTITGTSGSISHSGQRELDINTIADFTGFVTTGVGTVLPGQRASYVANVVPLNGFSGTVALTVSGLPPNATATLTPASVTGGSGSSSLLVTTSSTTPPGAYTLTITGACGSDVKSTTVPLLVNTSNGDFAGAISPQAQSVSAGGSATYGITISPLGGFTGDVTLSVTRLPPGASAGFNPGNVIPGGAGATSLTITTTNVTPPGSYVILLTGSSGGLSHSGSVNLTVN